MKKIRMNAAKLQLGKERIATLAMSRVYGGDDNNNPGGTGKETDSLCNDRCAPSWTCEHTKDMNCEAPPETGNGFITQFACVDSIDRCKR